MKLRNKQGEAGCSTRAVNGLCSNRESVFGWINGEIAIVHSEKVWGAFLRNSPSGMIGFDNQRVLHFNQSGSDHVA